MLCQKLSGFPRLFQFLELSAIYWFRITLIIRAPRQINIYHYGNPNPLVFWASQYETGGLAVVLTKDAFFWFRLERYYIMRERNLKPIGPKSPLPFFAQSMQPVNSIYFPFLESFGHSPTRLDQPSINHHHNVLPMINVGGL